MSERPELRIGDAEREAAAAALGEHFASGRLTREEYDERSDRVWAARTNSDLGPLFTDLPVLHARESRGGPPAAAPRVSSGDPSWGRVGSSDARRGRGGRGLRLPIVPLLLLAVVLIALPGPPWPLLLLGWLFLFGCLRGGWFRGHNRGRDRAPRGSWS